MPYTILYPDNRPSDMGIEKEVTGPDVVYINPCKTRFEDVERGDVLAGDVETLALAAHGTIRVPVGRGGEWTFQVQSDDGFELWIDGARFRAGQATSSYGSMFYAGYRPPGITTGTVELAPGDHQVELVYYEQGGYAELELSAKGPGNAQFARVGDPPATSRITDSSRAAFRSVSPSADP